MVAAALTGGLRQACLGRSAAFPSATSNAQLPRRRRRRPPSSIGSPSKASSTTFAARAKGRRAQTAPTPATAAASAQLGRAGRPAKAARLPAVFATSLASSPPTACKRDATRKRSRALQAGTAVLASLEALERQETTGILMKIRDAASANGGIEHVLSEMRPGGAFADLRKEFNVALSHDEGFAAAYEKATGALSSYAETRAGMISAPRPRADVNLARLETLDQEIGAAAKTLPGLKDGKNALDEALEGGKEAVEKAFTAIRQAFTRDADVRGPSPSPVSGRSPP